MPCKCGSWAINDDPLQEQCDRCWRDAIIHVRDEEIARLNELLERMRNEGDFLKAEWDRDDSLEAKT